MSSSPIPRADLIDVLSAARLGWSLAELRGRLRDPAPPHGPSHRTERALPLGAERTWGEQSIEVETAVATLAERLKVDFPIEQLSNQPSNLKGSASDRLRAVAEALTAARASSPAALSAAWDDVTQFFWSWDAAIQDEFAAAPSCSAAYQLGRGIAEIHWALDPGLTDDSDYRSWGFLLGDRRGEILEGLLVRLTNYYDPMTLHALRCSLGRWRALVESGLNRTTPNSLSALAGQAVIWHDLIVADRDGASLVAPSDVLRKPGEFLPVFRHLWPEALILGSGSLLLFFAAALLLSPGGQAAGAAIGILGILGVSGAALATRARAAAVGLLSTMRDQLYLDLAAENAFVGPRTSSRMR
jgi:hypothetical protein